ncbi:S41 family peptidase [Halosimplex marinum]|uniref:S41 family peptidase n=1 Tax=Halosimplex marinum TaxID=3396620 RepID=UPI003F574983
MSSEAELTHDEAVADVRAFVDAIEATHPAPFVRAGGRFEYYERVQSTLDALPPEGPSKRRLREELAALAAAVRDAHTFVVHPMADGSIPLRLGAVDGDIRVRAVRSDERRSLVGARLRRVAGVGVDELLDRQRRLRGSETPHGDRTNLLLSLRNWRSMATLLAADDRPARATFEFRAPDGSAVRETFEPTTDGGEWVAPSTLDRPASEEWPTYRLLPERDAAWLRVPSMDGHREAFEYRRDGLDEHSRTRARSLCRAATGEPAPEDFDDALGGVPAALDVFRDLAGEMAAAETETLVVDVRDNTGGNRILVDLLAYVLYGWDAVVTARDRPGALRYSDRLVEERGTDSFERADENGAWDLRPGEYAVDDGDPSVEDVRSDLRDSLPTFERSESPDWPFAGKYAPPTVVVATAATTFSAGFSLLAALRRLGASVVGTAPVQAPTYFGDVVTFELPNSGLTAMTATSRIETLPEGPDEVLEPDRQLTSEDFDRYDHDRDASVLLALDEYC